MIRPAIRRLFRLAVRRDDIIARDVDHEIRSHIALRAEQLAREGYTAPDALAEATRRFGSMEHARRELQEHAHQRERTMHAREWWDAVRQDLSYAVRGLRREPLFALFIVATLGLGIGANAAMFGVVDRLLLRGPDHIVDSKRVMRVYIHERDPGQGDVYGDDFGYVMYDVLKNNTHSFDGVAAYVAGPHAQTILGHGLDAQVIQQGQATADLFPMLGVRPEIGRFFTADEDRTIGPEPVVVLGYGLWQRVYGGDRGVLGKTITLRDKPYIIIGVAPKGFTGPQFNRVDVWLPVSLHVSMNGRDWTHTWHIQWLGVVARLKPGISREQASIDATAAYRHGYTGGEKEDAAADIVMAPLTFNDDGKESAEVSVSRWLVGVALVVLLIACSNVANLLLARAVRRRREVAVRLALGAGRRRLVQLLLTESVMLALLGGAAGLAVAWLTAQLMRTVLLTDIEWSSSPVDGRVLGVSALIAVGVGVAIGLVPALRSSRQDLTASLKSGIREGGQRGSRLRATLTVAQAALSVVLLVGAGLFVRSLSKLRALDLGMQPDRMLVVSPRWPSIATYDSAAQAGERARRARVFAEALAKVRATPGIEHASLIIGLPFRSGYQQFLRVPGWDSIPSLGGESPSIGAVTSDFFETAGTRLISGRTFTAADRAGSEPVAIVSETMARTLWPKGGPVGQCLYTGATKDSLTVCSRIVGVVADMRRFRINEKPVMHYYVPLGQEHGMGGTELVVRPHGDPAAAIAPLRKMLQAMDPTIAYVDESTLQTDVDPQVQPWRLGASVFGMMGLLALLVAAVGLYSVMSYLVAQRTHELGVRIALGAKGGDIVSLILRGGVGLAVLGIAIGLGLSLVAGRLIEPLLFNTSARDGSVFGGVALVLLSVAVLASVIPALRASRTNPLEALRSE